MLGIYHALGNVLERVGGGWVFPFCTQVVQKADGIDADTSVAGAQCQDQLQRHNAFLKRSADASSSVVSFRPKKRHRISVTKCLRILDNQALWVVVGVRVGVEVGCVFVGVGVVVGMEVEM